MAALVVELEQVTHPRIKALVGLEKSIRVWKLTDVIVIAGPTPMSQIQQLRLHVKASIP